MESFVVQKGKRIADDMGIDDYVKMVILFIFSLQDINTPQ